MRRPDYVSSNLDTDIEVVQGSALQPESLERALKDVHTAYYLSHSMGDPGTFEDVEKQTALNFSKAAVARGVRRIVHLGGLGDDDKPLSPI